MRVRSVESTTITPINSPAIGQASNLSSTSSSGTEIFMCRSMSDLSVDELQSLESIFVLICNLVQRDLLFASQFCDAIVVLNAVVMLRNIITLCKYFDAVTGLSVD